MSLQSICQFLAQHAPDIEIIELNQSTATVDLAAKAHNVEPGQIAKALSLKVKDGTILIITKGDARLDNKKLKSTFGARARMLSSDEAVNTMECPVGGACPFGLKTPISVYCGVPLKHYAEVLPAADAIRSTVRITPERTAGLTSVTWVDVCQ